MSRLFSPLSIALALAATPVIPALAHAQLAPIPPSLPRTHTPTPTKPAIRAEDLKTRLYIFADDSMQGRETGTLGNVKGTAYLAAEVKKIGLKPAGDSGTYFQTLPLRELGPMPSSSLRIIGGDAFKLYTDFLPYTYNTFAHDSLQVIYAGREGESSLTAEQVKGKLVIFSPNQNRRVFPHVEGAAAVGLIMLDKLTKEQIDRICHRGPYPAQPTQPTSNDQPAIFFGDSAAAKLFGKPIDSLTPGTTGKMASTSFAYVESPARFPARNVVAILPGSDPKLAGQYVAIGAHNDHIGTHGTPVDHDSVRAFNHMLRIGGEEGPPRRPTEEQLQTLQTLVEQLRKRNNNGVQRLDSIFNGADDDGSGSVSVLEIAQQLAAMKVKPKRSIIFVWHSGEEKGLWGSEWFTNHPTVPRDSIVTQLNIDMIGRGNASDFVKGGPDYLQLIGSRRLSTELGDLIERVNTKDKHGFTFDYTFDAKGHPQQIYCRSDHYSYARYGIPVTFFTTGGHPDYHQATDEPQYIDYNHMTRVASLISDVAVHVANMPQRPVVDQPKPDPNGQCIQ